MKSKLISKRESKRRGLPRRWSVVALVVLAAVSIMTPRPIASTRASQSAQDILPAAGDTCVAATVISPASLPFTEDGTLAGAGNDLNPGSIGCAPGAGNDVVYSFTPAATDTYSIGATPLSPFDLSLYVITDCANPAGTCVTGANAMGFDRGEVLTPTLTAGTRYFIVVDTPTSDSNAGGFHFSLRRGAPANDNCGTAIVVDPSRLPFSFSGTTVGGANDLDPGQSCLTSTQSTSGSDVMFRFTPADTQVYQITVTPIGHYDTSVYITTDCASIANCFGVDVGGAGAAEILRRTLVNGTTYFIVVDGFGHDAGDFTLSLTPSIARAPNAPTELTATAISATQIDLAWKDNSADEQGFRIERSLDGFNFNEVGTVGSNVTTFSDTTAFGNTLFFYRVFAFNGFGNSDPSNIAFAQTPNPVNPNPVISVTPTTIDFGSVRVTQSNTQTVTIMNNGAADLIITAISDPSGAFSIVNKPSLPLTIASMQSVDLSVRFAPIATGLVASSFSISSNDPTTPFVTVNMTGTGTAAAVANLEISPNVVDFGTSPTPIMVDLKNTGEADLLISSLILPFSPFGVSGGPFPKTLKTGEKVTLTITFSPTTLGVFQGGLTIVSNDPDSLLTFVPLRGTSLSQTLAPAVVGLQFKKNGLRFQSAGSNVVSGAVLIVDGTQTFALELNGDIWQVGKKAKSTPGNLRVRDIFVSPSTHTVVVRNPNGGTSTPVSLSV